MAWIPLADGMDAVLDKVRDLEQHPLSARIAGVKVKKLVRHADARGFFAEVLKRGDRDDSGEVFIPDQPFAQISRSVVYARGGNPPEPIKAFHWHRRQWDYWDVVAGNARVVLVDLRAESPTAGLIQVLMVGENASHVVAIPPRVAHGYQCLGLKDMHLVYYVSEPYDPSAPDEGRIAWNDDRIAFDWRIENI